MSKLIACQDCRQYRRDTDNHHRDDIWYDQHCMIPWPDEFDPVIGKFKASDSTRYCRDYNGKGDCPHFDPKIRV